MEIMMQLNANTFGTLADEFKRKELELGDGLPLLDFIELMLQKLPICSTASGKAEIIPKLIDLFNDIDVNGDERLEFEELTSYCVDAGLIATRQHSTPWKFRYEESRTFKDRTTGVDDLLESNNNNNASGFHRIKYVPSINKILVIESESVLVKFYENVRDDVILSHTLNVGNQVTLNSIEHESVTKTSTTKVKTDFIVLDVEVLHNVGQIAISSSDFTITFWDLEKYFYINSLRCQTSQSILTWIPGPNVLFSSGVDGVICTWKVQSAEIKLELKSSLNFTSTHLDAVLGLISVPVATSDTSTAGAMVLSCSMDRTVCMWDLNSNDGNGDLRYVGRLVGHKHGVRDMAYSSEYNVFFTTGFEFDVFVWDLSARQLMTKITGHRSALIGVSVMSCNKRDHVVSVDEEGTLKLWSVQRAETCTFTLVESFNLVAENSTATPSFFVTLPNRNVVTAGPRKLQLYESKRVVDDDDDSLTIATIYNPNGNQFIVVMSSLASVVVIDSETGDTTDEFHRIYKHDLLKCTVDSARKKLVAYTSGGTFAVFNIVNCALIHETTSEVINSVAGIAYDSPDKLVVTCTVDGSLIVLHDDTSTEFCTVRRMDRIVSNDSVIILDVAFSYNASLIATSSSDGVITLWDFETFHVEDIITVTTSPYDDHHHLSKENHVVLFIDPLPLLVAADSLGNIIFMATRPHELHGKILYVFQNNHSRHESSTFLTQESSSSYNTQPSIVCALDYVVEDSPSKFLLFTGDELGTARTWDFTALVEKFRMQAIPESKLLWKQRKYNALNSFKKNQPPRRAAADSNKKVRSDDSFETNDEKLVSLKTYWTAHKDVFRSITAIADPKSIITAAFDCKALIWDYETGKKFGTLVSKDEGKVGAWNFVADSTSIRVNRDEMVQDILAQLQEKSRGENKSSTTSITDYDDGSLNPLLSRISQKVHLKKMQAAFERKQQWQPTEEEMNAEAFDISTSLDESQKKNDSSESVTSETVIPIDLQERMKSHKNYTSMVSLQEAKSHRGKLKEMDISPSVFLIRELGTDDAIGKKIVKKNYQKKIQKLAPITKKISKSASSQEIKKTRVMKYIASQSKLSRIDDIILSTTSNSTSTTNNLKTHGTLQERLERTQHKFTAAINSTDDSARAKEKRNVARHRKERERDLKQQRMRKYLQQKEKVVQTKVGKALRHATSFSKNTSVDSYKKKKKDGEERFGMYTSKEVMSVIRLFWDLDHDMSGTIECDELLSSNMFSNLNIGNVAEAFQSLDLDGSGDLTLRELLTVSFNYASKSQISDMLELASVGQVNGNLKDGSNLTESQREELLAIFKLVDKDNSGGISLEEVMQLVTGSVKGNTFGSWNDGLSNEDITALFNEFDADGNGDIDPDEFLNMMQEVYQSLPVNEST